MLAEMNNCTLQEREGPDIYFARLYTRKSQLRQVGCAAGGYHLKANDVMGSSGECIPMLNRLRTMKPIDSITINDILREVYVNDVLPNRTKKDGGYRGLYQEAAMSTSVGSKPRVGRDIRSVCLPLVQTEGTLR